MDIIGFCGINCSKCPAYIATINNDNNERKKVAEQWSKQYNTDFKPEMINCYGCLDREKPKIYYCSDMCEIRKCALPKNIKNCAYCADYGCKKLFDFLVNVKDAKDNLEKIRNNLK